MTDPAKAASFARKRLIRDLKELQREGQNLNTVSALPSCDMFEWHCNLKPDEGPYAGVIFHVILKFKDSYPKTPPNVFLCTSIDHPNVFDHWFDRDEYAYICLDMLGVHHTSEPYAGWSSAYSVMSVLLQLQSFLFAENVPQDYGGYEKTGGTDLSIRQSIQNARNFTCKVVAAGGEEVVHTHSHPWPPLPVYKKQPADIEAVTLEPRDWPSLQAPPVKRFHTASSIGALDIPTAVSAHVFGYLSSTDLIKAQNVCSLWRRVIITYNLFERSQIACFHTRATLDDEGCILGFGVSVEYSPRNGGLKSVSSQLDTLSLEAFQKHGVRTGVWAKEPFGHFLPLILNREHAERAVRVAERSIYSIMKNVPPPPYAPIHFTTPPMYLHPQMILQLLSNLMNTMVVELMKDVDDPSQSNGCSIKRHASEKALEGYCAFHHMLLHFARRYPAIEAMANNQIDNFIASEEARHKRRTPDLVVLLVCLTLSKKGWVSLWKPLLLENFDRNVRWLLQKFPELANPTTSGEERLKKTIEGTTTSMRLLMFQVYFMSQIGRPAGTRGPVDVLKRYEKRLGRPTTAQKENLQDACKAILDVSTWDDFFTRCKVPIPTTEKLLSMLHQAVVNSRSKKYHTRSACKRRPRPREPRYR